MDDQNKNLILATALSFMVILVWLFLFPPPKPQPPADAEITAVDPSAVAPSATTPSTGAPVPGAPETQPAEAELATAARVAIDTPRVTGSISTLGGRIDDLSLKGYHETIDDNSPIVKVLQPAGTDVAYYALYGWAPGAGLAVEDVPGPRTEWRLEQGETLTVDTPVTLAWDNGKGLTFRRTLAIDSNYMFTVTQSVTNTSGGTVSAAPYGVIARHGEPKNTKKFFILHEGVVRMSDGTLEESDYKDIADYPVLPAEGARAEVQQVNENGWIGFTDHFWMATLIPSPGSAFKSVIKYDERRDIYQTEAVLPTQTIADGASASVTTQLFAGAKEWETIR
ncbi:MAG: membrane protein insertase YidC, partial [Pseudooceanicola sp.]|nr:membrane protein insertase YidC [Pseudooceanicola sp.]